MVNLLKQVGKKFRSVFKKIDGSSFYGQMLEIPDTSRVSNFLSARRYLRVTPESPIQPRDVIVVAGVTYIVATHGTGFYVDPIYRHMKLFEVDEVLPWYSTYVSQDPVTGIDIQVISDSPTTVYLSTQPRRDMMDEMQIPIEQQTAVCNAAVNVGDKIGAYKVTKVDKELGVYVIELKKV